MPDIVICITYLICFDGYAEQNHTCQDYERRWQTRGRTRIMYWGGGAEPTCPYGRHGWWGSQWRNQPTYVRL